MQHTADNVHVFPVMRTNQLQALMYFGLFATLTLCKDGRRNKSRLLDNNISHGDTSYQFPKFRRKRSLCVRTWTMDATCNCCQSFCTGNAFSEAYSLTHGNCTDGQLCCLYGHNPLQWTQNCSYPGVYFSVNCSYTETCSAYCKCEQGYNSTHCGPSNAHTKLNLIALVALLPAGVIIAAVVTYICIKYKMDREGIHESQPMSSIVSTICVRCNILVVVGNTDEIKIYAEQFVVAVEALGKKTKKTHLKVKRISIFHLFIDGYRIECNKVIFFLDIDNKSSDQRVYTCMEKIMFTKGRHNAAAVIYFDKTETPPGHMEETEDSSGLHDATESIKNMKNFGKPKYDIFRNEICSVSNIKEIEKWLPLVTRVTFNINLKQRYTKQHSSRQRRYFVKMLMQKCDTTESYKQVVQCILNSCGASATQVEDQAKCKIVIVESLKELTAANTPDCENCYIFSATNSNPVADIYPTMTCRVFCRDQIITGIFQVLHQLHIIRW